jgi:hypothetical protein
MENLERVIRTLDKARDPETPPAQKAAARLVFKQLTEYAERLPLVNEETGETRIVQSGLGRSAEDKVNRIFVESRGQWDVDYEEYERWFREEYQRRKERTSVFRWLGRKLAAVLHSLRLLSDS